MPTIDLAFKLVGESIPMDHGYALFSSVCKLVPTLHGDKRIGVHPIRGRQTAPGVLRLIEQSRLRVRLPSEDIAAYLSLAGSYLDLEGHSLGVGIPCIEALSPVPVLGARLVTYRHSLDPDSLITNVRGELAKIGINGEPQLVFSPRPSRLGEPIRRVFRVRDKKVVGYALRVSRLTPDASLKLQARGLGGRRRFGCGILVPIKAT
jgi:CRISPR-associated protein Cas6